MKPPFSHKYEIASFLDETLNSFGDATEDVKQVANMVRLSHTFRIADKSVLPKVKNYTAFYEFIKCPYIHMMLEMPDSDEWFVFSINDYTETDNLLGCILFMKSKVYSWKIITTFNIELDESGYEVKTDNDVFNDKEVYRRFAWVIFEFLIAINTPNIEQREIKPPKLINKKRERKGKPLLAGYHYLDLVPHVKDSHNTVGDRSAKRMHWRRGHIRRLKTKTTWVRPALIGQGEFIDKTYRINAPQRNDR